MKHLLYISYIALIVIAVSSCKTTEENYRKAYETATAKQNEGYTSDEIAMMAAEEAIPRTLYRGDSIPLKGMWHNTLKVDSTTQRAKRYNVVVGRYSQKFNALSVMKRLQENGYPSTFILLDRDQHFYVAPVSTDTLDRAVESWRIISTNPPFPLNSPFPYIIKRP